MFSNQHSTPTSGKAYGHEYLGERRHARKRPLILDRWALTTINREREGERFAGYRFEIKKYVCKPILQYLETCIFPGFIHAVIGGGLTSACIGLTSDQYMHISPGENFYLPKLSKCIGNLATSGETDTCKY